MKFHINELILISRCIKSENSSNERLQQQCSRLIELAGNIDLLSPESGIDVIKTFADPNKAYAVGSIALDGRGTVILKKGSELTDDQIIQLFNDGHL